MEVVISTLDLINKSIKENNNVDPNLVSDGYHTFGELYEHRIGLWIAYCKLVDLFYTDHEGYGENGNPVWKYRLHSDETSFDGWFILGIGDIPGKQMTYHLPINKWDECIFAKTLDKAPEFDGHTSEDVLNRIKDL